MQPALLTLKMKKEGCEPSSNPQVATSKEMETLVLRHRELNSPNDLKEQKMNSSQSLQKRQPHSHLGFSVVKPMLDF